MKRILLIIAAAGTLAAASCSVAHLGGRAAVRFGDDWTAALPRLHAWEGGARGRSFQVQDLDSGTERIHAPLDSLIIADAWRRAGLDHPMLRTLPAAPKQAGVLCRETYIFYLSGNRIVGVEYRAVESDGWGGYRQADEAVGRISDPPPPSS